MGIGDQHQRLPAEVALHRRFAQFGDLLTEQRSRQVARQLKQRLRATLAAGRNARLKTQAGDELPGQQTHHQHHGKGHQVLHVAHGKRQSWRHKKVVKRCHIEESRQRRRAAPELQRDQHRSQQKQHDDVGQVEKLQ